MKYYAIVTENGWGISNNEGYPYTSQEYTVTDLLLRNRLFRPLYKTVAEVKREIVSAQKMFPSLTQGIIFSYVEVDINVGDTVWGVDAEETDEILFDAILSKLNVLDAEFIRNMVNK